MILGIFAYNKIPKEIFPPTNLDAISISGHYSGASPDILNKMAVVNIEDELKNLSDISTIESTIKNGFFRIKADLKDNGDIEDTINEVKDIVSNIRRDLPSDMDEPITKRIKNSFPLVTIAIASNNPKEELLKIASLLKRELSSIKDLSDISVRGDVDKELLFKLYSGKIDALGLNKDRVIQSISSLSSIFPVGMIKQKGEHLFLSTFNGLKDIDQIKDTIISVGDKKVRVGDIAEISFSLSDPTEISHFNALPNISVNINKAKTGNSIALVKEIRAILKNYETKYSEYKFEIYTDTSIWIRNRLNTVFSNILFGLLLVSLSIWIFVNGRIAFVVGIGIPTSFIIGVIATQMMGYSINMLSLLGALIALGMLVDEAIVVAENIQSHLEKGDNPKIAAINGASEMFPAVLTATATTIFAFLPLLIMSGEMGIFIKVLPIMISILLLSSLVEAFFFLPLHAKEVIRAKHKKDLSERFWKWAKERYRNALETLLKFRVIVIVIFLIFTLGMSFIMLKNSKFQLFPTFDTTQIYVSGKVDKNYDIYQTQEFVTEVEKALLKNLSKTEISSITSISGMKLNAKFIPEIGDNFFHIFINLHERVSQNFYNRYINPIFSPEYDSSDMMRQNSAQDIAKDIEKITEKFQDNKNYEEFNVVVPGAGIVESDIEISLIGDSEKIKQELNTLQKEFLDIDGVSNVNHDLIAGEKEIKFRVNRYGESLGFNEKNIASSLRVLFLKPEISKMFYKDKLIRVKSQDINKDKVERVKNFLISIPNSLKKVRLSEVVEFIIKPSYATIFKDDGVKISTIYGSLDKEKITSSEFLKIIKPSLEKIREKGIKINIKGEEKENKKIKQEMSQAAVMAIFLIFLALIWMFNSISLSLFVLSTIPLSIFGVLLGHIIMGINLTMPGMLGIVGLAGVVVNDGIIMIDFLRKADNIEEFLQLSSRRLRPILLTSITTVLGLSTLIFFAEGQAVILQPMAISLGFGITWATVLNLLFLPILYATIHKIRS